jgi:hypothetical protein
MTPVNLISQLNTIRDNTINKYNYQRTDYWIDPEPTREEIQQSSIQNTIDIATKWTGKMYIPESQPEQPTQNPILNKYSPELLKGLVDFMKSE